MLAEGNDDDVSMRAPRYHSFIYCLHVSGYACSLGFAADYDCLAEQNSSLAACSSTTQTTKWPQQALQSSPCLRAASLPAMSASIASCVIAVIGTC